MALLVLLPLAFAEGMDDTEFYLIVDSFDIDLVPDPNYVSLNVDVKKYETIKAEYNRWFSNDNTSNCDYGNSPTVPLDRQPSSNYWIQFVSPSGELSNESCNLDYNDCLIPKTANEEGVWQVRFGAGITGASCDGLQNQKFTWGVKNWKINIVGTNKGRVWNDTWHLSTRGGVFTRNFFVLAKSLDSPESCRTELFGGDCKGELFREQFVRSDGFNWVAVSNSSGLTYSNAGVETNLRYSVPLQRDSETCLDTLLPERYTSTNTTIDPEHRIYLIRPEFFEKTLAPQLTQTLSHTTFDAQKGVRFSFTTNTKVYYELILDLDFPLNGFDPYSPGAKDVIFEGVAEGNVPVVINWHGINKIGDPVGLGQYDAYLRIYSATAHFPLLDFEMGNLSIAKLNDGGSFETQEVYWHDSIAGGSDNLAGGDVHSWTGCSRPNDVSINPLTNCFPFGFDNVDCQHRYVFDCCPADRSEPRLDLTLGDNDLVNTWVYGDFEEVPSHSFEVHSIIGVNEIGIPTILYDGDEFAGNIIIVNSEAGRELEVSVFDAITNQQLSTSTITLQGGASETIAITFGILDLGNYRVVAEIADTPCLPCRKEKNIVVIVKPREFNIPEIEPITILLVLFSVLLVLRFKRA
ncbi:MAG: hypothetical protein CL943_01235 [Candidatus Diapherotrites archaeon]|uniref:Uncharacterized protein n=1 Tax=Candidatus Iainarchaeum sp. TaxID=3101447 RepID=A0A2D6M0H2_9ARCH|nr:hypothetical protein [Candidatus Diapherotrites archaeon]